MALATVLKSYQRGLSVLTVGLALGFAHQSSLYAAEDGQALLNAYWHADSPSERQASRDKLLATANTQTLYQWLSDGPTFNTAAETGQISKIRTDTEGTEFPYAVLVPKSYSPDTAYPVEFMLHGGVGRPKQEPGASLWRSGYDSLEKEDRITVVPAAWSDAYWWQASQADNLADILHRLKRDYHIDDNRVSMTGVSDGGTGAYFFAFKQPTQWASFMPYIGHPGVLRNAGSGGYKLFFENLTTAALYIVNGENDRLYPAKSVMPFIDILEATNTNYVFTEIKGGGHNTRWLPGEADKIEEFKSANPRDPFPDVIRWIADRTDRYNRNRWIQIDAREEGARTPAVLEVHKTDNHIEVSSNAIAAFTLLLNPEQIDFSKPVVVTVNGEVKHDGLVTQNSETLLDWFEKDHDKAMLFTAALTISMSD